MHSKFRRSWITLLGTIEGTNLKLRDLVLLRPLLEEVDESMLLSLAVTDVHYSSGKVSLYRILLLKYLV